MPESVDYTNSLLDSLLKERESLTAQLVDLQNQARNAKGFHRIQLNHLVNQMQQSLRQNANQIQAAQRIDVRDTNAEGKAEADRILAEKGIDARANRFNAVGSSVSSGLSSISSAVGQIYGGKFGVFGQGKADQIAAAKGTITPTAQNNKNMIYLGICAVVLLLVIMMKKK